MFVLIIILDHTFIYSDGNFNVTYPAFECLCFNIVEIRGPAPPPKKKKKKKKMFHLRLPGIEPGSQEWESCMIPLHQRRSRCHHDSVVVKVTAKFHLSTPCNAVDWLCKHPTSSWDNTQSFGHKHMDILLSSSFCYLVYNNIVIQ